MTTVRSDLERKLDKHANDRAVLLGRSIGLLQSLIYCSSGVVHDEIIKQSEALIAEWEIHVGELFR